MTAPINRDAGTRQRNLMLRVASAAVLVPVALLAAYLGGWIFLVLCVLAALGILWEWSRLTGGSDAVVLALGVGALFVAFASMGFGHPVAAAGVIGISAPAAGIVTSLNRPADQNAFVQGIWAACGFIYAGTAFLGPALLRRDAEFGLAAFLYVALIVWATDTCAFAAGRALGGPRLWSYVSPNKTWSGALGGLVGGVAAGTLVAYSDGLGRLAVLGVIALVLSALAQAGDLLESAIKRHFGAKDTSELIPGHGGLMDRLDGFLVAGAAALLIGILRQGTAAPAHGLLVW